MATFFRSDGWVKSALGQAIAGAQIYIVNQPADIDFLPPIPLMQVYADPAGIVPITQPVNTDGFGHYDFYVTQGTYTIVVVTGGSIQQVYPDQTIGYPPATSGTFPVSISKQSHQWLDSYNSITGQFTQSRPVASDISGLAAVATSGSYTDLSNTPSFVSSLNSLTGAVSITAGSNVTVLVSGSSIQISSTGGGGSSAFNAITSGTNTTAAMVVGSGATLGVSGSGTIAATSSPFSGLITGTNTGATMTLGSGASILVTGTGIVQATQIQAVVISASAPSSGQVLTATSSTGANWQTPSSGGSQPVDDSIQPLPTIGTLTAVNGITSVQNVTNGSIRATISDNSSLNWRVLVQTVPATPYKVKFKLTGMAVGGGYANSQTYGIYFYDGTKLLGFEFLMQASSGAGLRVERMANVNTDTSTQQNPSLQNTWSFNQLVNSFQYTCPWAGVWLQLRNDGTNLYFDFSTDGANFVNSYSEAVGAFLTPTAVGIGGVSITSNSGKSVVIDCLSWQVFNNANL